MNKLWVGRVFGSLADGDMAGVLTLVNKTLPFDLESQWSDQEGRVSHIVITHGGISMSIYNIYGLNDDNKTFLQSLGSRLASDPSSNIEVGGDLNSVHIPTEDPRGVDASGTPKHALARDRVLPPS